VLKGVLDEVNLELMNCGVCGRGTCVREKESLEMHVVRGARGHAAAAAAAATTTTSFTHNRVLKRGS
jgi:hypothetical protein